MSLKAKLEAVIYAAEEPVTLSQLAALFAAEALEWKAEQAAAAAATEAAAEPTQLPMIDEGLSYLGLEQTPAFYAASSSENIPAEQPREEAVETPDSESPEAPAGLEPSSEAGEATDPEADAKRLARQRDREVKVILRQLLDELIATYAADERGIEIREIAGGYRMATKPECHDAVRLLIKSLKPPMKLSLPALETLAVIAYKQPVTAPEVSEIRGVESAGVLGSLLARKLIATAGRKQVIGRPILYKTTKEFLLRFGLKDVAELPSMEEFEKMAAIELAESETEEANEEITGPELDENALEEGDESPAAFTSPDAQAGSTPENVPAAEAATHD
jgi:segregation and condensation protein B